MAVLVFLDVFLFEAEGFGGVEDEHFHADIGGDFGASEFGDDNHESNGERDSPDGRLFAEDSQERMSDPEIFEVEQAEVTEAGERDRHEREQPAGEHSSGGTFHGHAAPPRTHEEKREITGGRDGKRLADHVIDVELLNLHAEENRHYADDHRGNFEGARVV